MSIISQLSIISTISAVVKQVDNSTGDQMYSIHTVCTQLHKY